MASRFWVGGTGTWDAADTSHWAATSGGASGASVPTSSDDVTFDSNSGTTATVTTSGASRPANTITINKSDLTLTFGNTVTVTGAVTLTTGTLNTAGFALSAASLSSSGSGTRAITFGASTVTLSGNNTVVDFSTSTNLTLSAASSTIVSTGINATYRPGGLTTNGSVTFAGVGFGSIDSTSTFVNVTRTGTAVKTDEFRITSPATTITCTGTFTVTGNSATNRVLVYSTTLGTARSISAASVSLTNVDFRDITAAGAAAPFTGTSIGDALGNTNITADTPIDCYRVGAGGNWSTANWYTTSGGATPARVPLPQDTARIDANASGTITNDMPRMGADIDFTGFAGTFTNSVATEVYGSPTLGSGMTLSGTNDLSLRGRSSHTITNAGKAWACTVIVNCATGTYTLADALTSSRSASALQVISGTFSDGGFSITLNGAAADMRVTGGTLTASGTTTIASTTATTPWSCTGGTVNHTGTIVLSGATATDRTFAGGGKTYGTLTDQNTSTGKLTVTGANTFGTINKTAGAACTLALPTSSGITVTGIFNVYGTADYDLTLTGDVTKADGTVSCDYLAISSSDAAGGAYFYAGANSTDGGSNTGWIFGAPSGGRPYKGGYLKVEPTVEGALVVL